MCLFHKQFPFHLHFFFFSWSSFTTAFFYYLFFIYLFNYLFVKFFLFIYLFIIYLFPPSAQIIVLQLKSFHEIIRIGHQKYRTHDLPWFRTINWYFVFTANYFFYGDGLTHFYKALFSHEVCVCVCVCVCLCLCVCLCVCCVCVCMCMFVGVFICCVFVCLCLCLGGRVFPLFFFCWHWCSLLFKR